MHLAKLTLIAALCNMTCGLARAEEPATDWKALGPAFSYHFTKDGALRFQTPPTWSCQISHEAWTGNVWPRPVTSTTSFKTTQLPFDPKTYAPAGPVATALGKPSGYGNPSQSPSGGLEYKASGSWVHNSSTMANTDAIADCVTDNKPGQDRSWHQNNPALGLQYEWRYSDHVDLVYATYVRDSYGTASFMVAGGREWPLAKLGTVNIEGGVVAGLWRRSEVIDNGWSLERRTVPYVLPALSVTESTTGIGINMGIAPRVMVRGHYWNATTTAMFQLTYFIHKTEAQVKPGLMSVSLEANPQGGTQASVGYAF